MSEVTLSELRDAARAIPEKPERFIGTQSIDSEWAHYFDASQYEHARAEFWKVAFKWAMNMKDRFDGGYPETMRAIQAEENEASAIIAEVEART